MKRLLIISDLHCGHHRALAPKRWNSVPTGGREVMQSRRRLFSWWKKETEALGVADILLCNGDLIDGRGERSGSTELLSADRHEQCAMATECIQGIKRVKTICTYGTPYHVGQLEDFENDIADTLDADISAIARFEVNGHWVNARHHCGGTTVPYSKATGICKEAHLATTAAAMDGERVPDIIIRSHVHNFISVESSRYRCMTTPCLQMGSKYGDRRCLGTVDLGFLELLVADTVTVIPHFYLPKH